VQCSANGLELELSEAVPRRKSSSCSRSTEQPSVRKPLASGAQTITPRSIYTTVKKASRHNRDRTLRPPRIETGSMP